MKTLINNKNKKYKVRKYQAGWIVTTPSGFQIYFENYNELTKYINS